MQAFYTLVRFIPDTLRGEQVNIAVVLQCPERGFADMRTRTQMDKAINRLSRTQGQFVTSLTEGICEVFRTQKPDPTKPDSDTTKPEYFDRFKDGYSVIAFDEPRALALPDDDDLDKRMNQLFVKLVEGDD